MWDGDSDFLRDDVINSDRSEPTVWDGDGDEAIDHTSESSRVLSPPCGMETTVAG